MDAELNNLIKIVHWKKGGGERINNLQKGRRKEKKKEIMNDRFKKQILLSTLLLSNKIQWIWIIDFFYILVWKIMLPFLKIIILTNVLDVSNE